MDRLLACVCKYMIHVFVTVLIVSIIIMTFIVNKSYQIEYDQDKVIDAYFEKLTWFVNHHPNFYTLNQLSGANFTNVVQYAQAKVKESSNFEENDILGLKIIHPLYVELQEASPLNLNKNYTIDTIQKDEIGIHQFYSKYVAVSLPLVFLQSCNDWILTQELKINRQNNTQKEYLQNQFERMQLITNANQTVSQFKRSDINYTVLKFKHHLYKQGLGHEQNNSGSYEDFIQVKDGFLSKAYIQDLNLASYPKLRSSSKFSKNILEEILRPRKKLFTQWTNFIRKPKKVINEQYVCVVQGSEEFKLVSPIFRQNIYIGVFDKLKSWESPIDFFEPDYKKYPLAKQARFINVTLNEGDCLYIPAYYYVQSKTLAKESINITHEYFSHSQLVDMIFNGLEEGLLTDSQMHKYDDYISNFF